MTEVQISWVQISWGILAAWHARCAQAPEYAACTITHLSGVFMCGCVVCGGVHVPAGRFAGSQFNYAADMCISGSIDRTCKVRARERLILLVSDPPFARFPGEILIVDGEFVAAVSPWLRRAGARCDDRARTVSPHGTPRGLTTQRPARSHHTASRRHGHRGGGVALSLRSCSRCGMWRAASAYTRCAGTTTRSSTFATTRRAPN